MFWLVDADFAAAGERERGELSPTLLVYIRDSYVLRLQIVQRCGEVVAHEVELVLVVLFGIVECGFGGREGEDQPAVACVNGREFEDIAKEGAVGFGVFGVDHDVCAVDHGCAWLRVRATELRSAGQPRAAVPT